MNNLGGKAKVARSKTGVPGLDNILNGGFIPHRLYLIDGDPGAGKTTLSLQYLLEGVKAGEKCLYITLSETKEELIAGAESHDWSLAGIEIVELIAEEKVLDGDAQVTMYPPSEVELTETTKKILDCGRAVQSEPRCLRFAFRNAIASPEFAAVSATDFGPQTVFYRSKLYGASAR